MIPKEKIEQKENEYAKKTVPSGGEYDVLDLQEFAKTDFISGVSFAESELKSVAMEFAEWCANNNYQWNKTYKYWYNDKERLPYKSPMLIAKFMEERGQG